MLVGSMSHRLPICWACSRPVVHQLRMHRSVTCSVSAAWRVLTQCTDCAWCGCGTALFVPLSETRAERWRAANATYASGSLARSLNRRSAVIPALCSSQRAIRGGMMTDPSAVRRCEIRTSSDGASGWVTAPARFRPSTCMRSTPRCPGCRQWLFSTFLRRGVDGPGLWIGRAHPFRGWSFAAAL